MPILHVWPEEIIFAAGHVSHRARVEGAESFELWFRVPAEHAALLTQRAESFTAATILLAMRRGAELRVHAPLSPSFLRNLEELQALWHCWDPALQCVEIVADAESESPVIAPDRAVSTFSGGVDSCFTVWRHTQKRCGRRALPLTTALLLHGSEIALAQVDKFARARQEAAQTLASVQVTLVPIATNFRTVMPEAYVTQSFGSLLAAALLLFQESHATALIPASFSYYGLVLPYASTPLNDPLFSTARFRIEHDGALASRSEKVRELIAWPTALENLRVCNNPHSADLNCGHCEKCVRNQLSLRLAGLPQPPCFASVAPEHEIERLVLTGTSWEAMRRVLVAAHAQEVRAPWVAAVETALRRNARRERWDPLRRRVLRRLPGPLVPTWARLQKRLFNV